MGNLARVIMLLGGVLVVIAVRVLGKNVIDVNQLHAVVSANRSLAFSIPPGRSCWALDWPCWLAS